MKFCRFGANRLGVVVGDVIHDVTAALDVLPTWQYPLPSFDPLIANLDAVRERAQALVDHAETVAVTDVHLLSPVANPGKIIAAPVNYTKHLREVLDDQNLHHGNLINHIEKAGLFLKAGSSLVGAGDGVQLSHTERRNDHEVELAVVIGKTGRNIKQADALGYVAGYCIGLDMTIRGPEERSFRKSPDSYTVFGPWLVTSDELGDPNALDLSIAVNGEIRQKANTSDLIIGVASLIEFASSFYTLHPGDVIITGTPEGVSPVVPGDTMVATIERIGQMTVKVS
ncbi:fumarylacetoacetate hydrolase family protein [Paraburkholderia sp. MPAMCS5]|uniref:fumarylacetoacetate hydrolase family protein n=1 Tax=Paraburkholderia sp. MPAMCS5 TaxID=3112563 RepID=UPI002E182247|nr:fumarylacetoacetate hydrolase family protein [Paraburkholderia sp. MPAMCS5]